MKKPPLTDIDYVELYASRLRVDKSLFNQQKILIESQLKSSREIFRNKFGQGEDFKKNARIYLKNLGLI